jgi:hypothetical protein
LKSFRKAHDKQARIDPLGKQDSRTILEHEEVERLSEQIDRQAAGGRRTAMKACTLAA